VSRVPAAWEHINEFTNGAWWRLRGPGRFLDVLELGQQRAAQMLHTRPDLVRSHRHYWVEVAYDDELETCTFESGPNRRQLLKDVRDHYDLEEAGEVTEGLRWEARPALKRILTRAGVSTEDFVFTAALLEVAFAAGLDGLWWMEDFDPWHLSAPRGAIHRARIRDWSVTEVRRGSVNEPEW